jgi:hypothetical protein
MIRKKFKPGSLRNDAEKVLIEVSVFSDMRTTTIEAEITFTLKNGKKVKYMYDNSDGTISKDHDGSSGYSSMSDEEHQEVDELVEERMMELVYKVENKLPCIREKWEGKSW